MTEDFWQGKFQEYLVLRNFRGYYVDTTFDHDVCFRQFNILVGKEHEVSMFIMVAGSIDGIEIFEEELHKSIEHQVCIFSPFQEFGKYYSSTGYSIKYIFKIMVWSSTIVFLNNKIQST